MTQDRIALLEEVDFAWTAKSPEEQVLWEERLAQLREYKAEYGNCLVPRSYSANSQLGAWVHYQRQQYRLLQKGKRSQMTIERADILHAEGFVWNVQGHRPWEERLEELRAFKSQHGSCLVPVKYSPNPQLGNWVHNQRKEYKSLQEKKKSALTQDRIRILEREGFVWDTRHANTTSSSTVAHAIARAHAHAPPLFINEQAVAMTMIQEHSAAAESSEVSILADADGDGGPSFGHTGPAIGSKENNVEFYTNI